MLAEIHSRQSDRLAALQRLAILDTPREEEFDDVVRWIAAYCDLPVALISLVDEQRQWFKSEIGTGLESTPIDQSICSHAILSDGYIEIPDTHADVRTRDNPLCAGDDGYRFYAGSVLTTTDGLPLGTLCVLDKKPRSLDAMQREALRVMAQRVMREIEHRHALRQQRILRKEIDHRVKNSLAMVGAVIHLQSQRAQSAEVKEALSEVRARMLALEAFHEELHQDNEHETVALESIARRTTEKLAPLLPVGLTFDVDLPPVELVSEQANAVALVINEFVTNSAKHAFNDRATGRIAITGEVAGDRLRLVIKDDGSGGASALAALSDRAGLGARVIGSLVRSLGGSPEWSGDGTGLTLSFDFPLKV